MGHTQAAAWYRLLVLFAAGGIVGWLGLAGATPAEAPPATATADPIRDIEREAEQSGRASWGHWGIRPDRYVEWSNHSNRLIPVYAFGVSLDAVTGPRRFYRAVEP